MPHTLALTKLTTGHAVTATFNEAVVVDGDGGGVYVCGGGHINNGPLQQTGNEKLKDPDRLHCHRNSSEAALSFTGLELNDTRGHVPA